MTLEQLAHTLARMTTPEDETPNDEFDHTPDDETYARSESVSLDRLVNDTITLWAMVRAARAAVGERAAHG